ncbi:MAG: RDD family protein, partial [Candidatus Eremiobacteraeota bacterium]|nr:RDD family protein [Candidatus Eremiobacteraeota bacterium]
RWFARERNEEPPALTEPGSIKVSDKDCAGWWRRVAAYAIDFVVVSAVITSFGGNVVAVHRDTSVSVAPGNVNVSLPTGGKIQIAGKKHGGTVYCAVPSACPPAPSPSASGLASPSPRPNAQESLGPFLFGEGGVSLNVGNTAIPLNADTLTAPIQALGINFWFPLYLAVLVVVAGQSFGMMISGLRVVTVDYGRPGIFRTLVRYALVFALWWLIIPLSFFWHRVLLHDRLTKTRLVKVERVVARATGTV